MTAQDVQNKDLPSVLLAEFHAELLAIAEWWLEHSVDSAQGGFYGEVSADNQAVPGAAKGIVLNTRILWFFSEAAASLQDPRLRQVADRAFHYLLNTFVDPEHGGLYWSVTASGEPLDTKKQVYAQAFGIYALTAYFKLTGNPMARQHALDCFQLLETRSMDREKHGYLEAFRRDWSVMEDVRLSDKDLNFPKTMNTHLHVLEAYTALHTIVPSAEVKAALRYTIDCFDQFIINRDSYHLRMFMDLDWQDHSPGYTYGHDIECSWLLAKALDSLGDQDIEKRMRPDVLGLARTCLNEAIGQYGEILEGYDFHSARPVEERIWWAQAESLVGFLKAYQLSGENEYFEAAKNVWSFIKQHQIDTSLGEWFWLSTVDDQSKGESYKLGFWKGPYHNGRAMLEAAKIVSQVT